ncbi:hypothetical protein LTR85_012262 [Meristemomyces frigidus]|nr:hypothetical protein LTR85_012262 [Meristemomyces frigidus]
MPQDEILYQALEVDSEASAETIRHAYRRLALLHHPDKHPDAGTKKFQAIAEAYEVLSDDATRQAYNEKGYVAVMHHEPPSSNDNSDSDQSIVRAAQAQFTDFLDEDSNTDKDPEIEDLLDWWTNPQLDIADAKACLRIHCDDYYDQLVAAFAQYRLTHAATTNDDKRSEAATSTISSLVEKHFGTANRKRLSDWNTNSPLEPLIDGKYMNKQGNFVECPDRPMAPRLPVEIEAVHLRATDDFADLVRFNTTSSRRALKALRKKHGVQYARKWHAVDERDKYVGPKERQARAQFPREIEWDSIMDELKNLQRTAQGLDDPTKVTAFKIAESVWQKRMKDYGFPARWDTLVQEHVTKHASPTYTQSVFHSSDSLKERSSNALQPSVSDAEDTDGPSESTDATPSEVATRPDDTPDQGSGKDLKVNPAQRYDDPEVASTSKDGVAPHTEDLGNLPDADFLTIRDAEVIREVFGYRTYGRGHQLFLRMTPKNAEVAVYDIVPSAGWKGLLEEIKVKTCDFNGIRGDKASLLARNYADIDWLGIAIQRRDKAPPGGWAQQPQTYVLCRTKGEDDESPMAFTRTDMRAAFGKDLVDGDIRGHIEQAGQKLPSPPKRKVNAIKYEAQAYDSNDSEETQSDKDFREPHPGDRQKLLTNETSSDQKALDELVPRLAKSYRLPSKAAVKEEPVVTLEQLTAEITRLKSAIQDLQAAKREEDTVMSGANL